MFGEKGSGKTAMRLQIVRHLADYNATHPNERVFVIEYDDFNPFLDRFRDRFGARHRRADRVLADWKLWDHMDAILSLGVTGLVDRILEVEATPAIRRRTSWARPICKRSTGTRPAICCCWRPATTNRSAETTKGRWRRLRRKLRFRTWPAQWDWALGAVATVATSAA